MFFALFLITLCMDKIRFTPISIDEALLILENHLPTGAGRSRRGGQAGRSTHEAAGPFVFKQESTSWGAEQAALAFLFRLVPRCSRWLCPPFWKDCQGLVQHNKRLAVVGGVSLSA